MTFRSEWRALVVAGALVAPAMLSAQAQERERSHVVRAGETLWRIAQDSLGNGHRWREILALNGLRTAEDLEVGRRIRLPARVPGGRPVTPAPAGAASGGAARPAPPVARTPAAPPVTRAPVAEAPRTPAPAPTAPATAPPRPVAPGRADSVERTVFFGAEAREGRAGRDSSGAVVPPAVPPAVFEALSAPFVAEGGLLERAGRCVALGDSSALRGGGVMLYGRVSLAAPRGTAAAGSRWVLVRRGPVLPGLGPVAIPAGVVRVTGAGTPATAAVLAQFDALTCDELVLPVETLAPPGARPVPVTDGAEGRVVWVASGALLPGLHHAFIVDIGGRSVRPGDVVTAYAGSGEPVATARVVRTGSRSATALVMRQSSGALAAGLRVRVTEKLP